MPPYFLSDGPEPPPPVPAWGSLALDIYLLKEWDTPHPESAHESTDQRRRRLVRQFLKLGALGREPYYKSTDAPLHPTEAQIETILRPLRPESLRRYATWAGDEGLWVRTNYDEEYQESHESLWEEYVLNAEAIGPDSLVLADPELFETPTDLGGVLELFPERVTNVSAVDRVRLQEKVLAEILQEWENDEDNDDEDTEVEREMICRKYHAYHAACVVTHIFVEDEEALKSGHVLHVFLDDCGNVVRQERVDSDSVDNFDGSWLDGSGWKESFVYPSDVGPEYLPGGARGPPYG